MLPSIYSHKKSYVTFFGSLFPINLIRTVCYKTIKNILLINIFKQILTLKIFPVNKKTKFVIIPWKITRSLPSLIMRDDLESLLDSMTEIENPSNPSVRKIKLKNGGDFKENKV